MMPATTLPCVLAPESRASHDVPLSSTVWIACTLRCAVPIGCVASVTCVSVCEKCTASVEIPLSVTATICGGTAAVSLLYFCSAQTPPGNGPVQVPVLAPVQQAVGLPAATHWELLVQMLFDGAVQVPPLPQSAVTRQAAPGVGPPTHVRQPLTGDCVHRNAP